MSSNPSSCKRWKSSPCTAKRSRPASTPRSLPLPPSPFVTAPPLSHYVISHPIWRQRRGHVAVARRSVRQLGGLVYVLLDFVYPDEGGGEFAVGVPLVFSGDALSGVGADVVE